jgi:hypothetical protein
MKPSTSSSATNIRTSKSESSLHLLKNAIGPGKLIDFVEEWVADECEGCGKNDVDEYGICPWCQKWIG